MAVRSSNPPTFPSSGLVWNNNSDINPTSSSGQHLVNSKIMVVAVAVLFAVVVFIFSLHLYAKWFWRQQDDAALRLSRSGSWRRRRSSRRSSTDPLADHRHPQLPLFFLQSVGLEKSVVESLPTFVYKKEDFVQDTDASSLAQQQQQQLECAVCLEEFKDNETGRTLPKCGHCFHVECIDMWFHSHSSCPLCRASARPDDPASTEKPSPAFAVTAGVTDEAGGQNVGAAVSTIDSSLATAAASARNLQRQEVETDNQRQREANGTWKPQPQIPPNVLFWGVGVGSTSEQQEATSLRAQAAAAAGRSSARLRAPFQVAIDIPQGGSTAETTSSPSFSTPKSPMARFMSFTRLLSRGKSIAASAGPSPSSSSSSSSSSSHSSLHLPADSEQAPAPSPVADP